MKKKFMLEVSNPVVTNHKGNWPNKYLTNDRGDSVQDSAIKHARNLYGSCIMLSETWVNTLNNSEMLKIRERFGDDLKCSFGKNDRGQYFLFRAHRRSKPYNTIEEIPIDVYDEISLDA